MLTGPNTPAVPLLLRNVHVLDAQAGALLRNRSVLVEGETIRSVSDQPIEHAGARVVDGGGRVLMPEIGRAHV